MCPQQQWRAERETETERDRALVEGHQLKDQITLALMLTAPLSHVCMMQSLKSTFLPFSSGECSRTVIELLSLLIHAPHHGSPSSPQQVLDLKNPC